MDAAAESLDSDPDPDPAAGPGHPGGASGAGGSGGSGHPVRTDAETRLRRIRVWLAVFIVGLVLSGATAFPLETETRWLAAGLHGLHLTGPPAGPLTAWIDRVHTGLAATNRAYPFLAYGTDWLAFAHLVIAVLFVGPLRDPVREKWTVQWGVVACAAIVPLALVCGPVRGIPFGWTLVDCSFGVFGVVPLLLVLRDIKALEAAAPVGAAGPARREGSSRPLEFSGEGPASSHTLAQ